MQIIKYVMTVSKTAAGGGKPEKQLKKQAVGDTMIKIYRIRRSADIWV